MLEAADRGERINAVAPNLAMHPFLAQVITEEMPAGLVKKEVDARPAEV